MYGPHYALSLRATSAACRRPPQRAKQETPRELRHGFTSLLADQGVPLEEISRLVGHFGTAVTEAVYRKQIRPVIQTGATIMRGIFKEDPKPWALS
ncbi:hypothetical protein [Streptomyces sp. NPDC086989]|uniref:hypothetical protein n=1 Tax=Streptomyces sp. NPDC086989 TaxID=3365764 RepID=UPI0038160996